MQNKLQKGVFYTKRVTPNLMNSSEQRFRCMYLVYWSNSSVILLTKKLNNNFIPFQFIFPHFLAAFAQVIKELWSEDSFDRVVNTLALKSQIQRFAPRFMGYAQQDAQEFLRYLLEGLHEDVNRVIEKPKPILTEIDEKLR